MTALAWFGLSVMVVSEAATLARTEPFWSWNTPIAWTGFLLFADAVVYRARGNSWMRSNGVECAALAVLSIPLWLVFEGYNLTLDNWYYTGLPEHWWLRQFGYAWAFATIWPAIFEGAELMAVALARRTHADPPPDVRRPSRSIAADAALLLLGGLMLSIPFLVPRWVARYLAAPVWLGFIFLLDPINDRLGAESLGADLRAGRFARLVNLMTSGLVCGILWEFWNFWSAAKWHYTVPIMENYKLFEMPVPGYLGFPAFALECFTMYVFVRRIFTRAGRPIAL